MLIDFCFWVCFGNVVWFIYLVNSVGMISSLFVGSGVAMFVGCDCVGWCVLFLCLLVL